MRKIILSALVAVGLIAGAGAARAEKPADPGREHGMCTAFFNGEKKGHEKQDEYPGPFQALLDDAPDGSDENDEGGDVADLYDWCQQYGIGGNSDGRWDCVHTPGTQQDPDGNTTCTPND